MPPFLNASPVELILQGYDQRVNIALYDEDSYPVDATALSLEVMDISKSVLYTDDFFSPPVPPTRIFKPVATTGEYYINWGDPGISGNTETNTVQDLFFVWRAVGGTGSEPSTVLQVVKVVDPIVLSFLPRFRLQVDKAAKIIQESADIFTGFSDAMLVQYLEGGLNLINVFQPNTSITLENFPRTHLQLLYDVATLVCIQSQALYAIDVDIPSYSDQGYSFAIDHFPKLQSMMSAINQRIDKLVPLFKLNFATMGSIHLEGGVSYRLTQLLQAAPPGSLFRGYFTS